MTSMKISSSKHAMMTLTHVLMAEAAISSQKSASTKSILMSSVMPDGGGESGSSAMSVAGTRSAT